MHTVLAEEIDSVEDAFENLASMPQDTYEYQTSQKKQECVTKMWTVSLPFFYFLLVE